MTSSLSCLISVSRYLVKRKYDAIKNEHMKRITKVKSFDVCVIVHIIVAYMGCCEEVLIFGRRTSSLQLAWYHLNDHFGCLHSGNCVRITSNKDYLICLWFEEPRYRYGTRYFFPFQNFDICN